MSAPLGYIVEAGDFAKLRTFANTLGDGTPLSDGQRRDMSHKIWLILTAAEKLPVTE